MLNICNWLIIRMSNLLTEENKRMGKTRYLFKKIRNTKETFHAKMVSIKDRNGMDLKKQKILRRGGKNTQVQFSSVAESCPTLQPHESQHARPPCPSASPGVRSDSCPSSQWCHPAISSSVVPFSSCPQSLPASESFTMSQLFAWISQYGPNMQFTATWLQ